MSAYSAGDLGSVPGLGRSPAEGKGYRSSVLGLLSTGKESTCDVGDLGSILSWEDPLEEDMATHSYILQARILEWVAIPFSRGFSQPRD